MLYFLYTFALARWLDGDPGRQRRWRGKPNRYHCEQDVQARWSVQKLRRVPAIWQGVRLAPGFSTHQ
jgi:hypothetical protein